MNSTMSSWSSIKATTVFTFILSLLAIAAYSEKDPQNDLTGPSFDDPAHIQEMPEKWKKQPVKYSSANADADIVITLDGQMFDAWERIINKFAAKNNLKIITNRGTCGVSAGELSRKSIDIGAFCCPPHATDRFPALKFHTVGISAIAFLVHPDNPVDNITVKQAREIFQGKTYRWADVMPEGKGKSTSLLIQPVGRLHCKLRPGHWRLLLDNEDLFSPGLLEIGAIPDMISQVAINKRAIGYEIPWMTNYYKNTGRVKILSINGHSPNERAHVISTDYPFYRVYSFTTWETDSTKNPQAHKLVDYLMQQSEHLDSKYSFIPSSSLRQAGWKFRNNELVGEPD
ncbi:MAG: substrate-binding domain-containing protein [Nitrospirota bacterium]